MDFDLPPELAELQATVRKLAQEQGRAPGPRDRPHRGVSRRISSSCSSTPASPASCIPEEYGGSGAGILGLAIAIEEVAKYSNAAALMLLLTRLPTGPLLIAGSEEQKQQVPHAARDRRAARRVRPLRAAGRQRRDGHAHQGGARRRRLGPQRHEVLDVGRACRPTGTASSPRPVPPTPAPTTASASFIVERGWDGVSVGRIDKKMGVKGVDTGELILDDVRVPAENIVGEIGGFRLCMLGLNSMRPIVAARGIGLAEGALDVRGRVREAARRVHARRSPTSRASSGRSPSSRPRSRPRGCSPTAPRGWPTRASSPRSTCPTSRCASTTPPSSR